MQLPVPMDLSKQDCAACRTIVSMMNGLLVGMPDDAQRHLLGALATWLSLQLVGLYDGDPQRAVQAFGHGLNEPEASALIAHYLQATGQEPKPVAH